MKKKNIKSDEIYRLDKYGSQHFPSHHGFLQPGLSVVEHIFRSKCYLKVSWILFIDLVRLLCKNIRRRKQSLKKISEIFMRNKMRIFSEIFSRIFFCLGDYADCVSLLCEKMLQSLSWFRKIQSATKNFHQKSIGKYVVVDVKKEIITNNCVC